MGYHLLRDSGVGEQVVSKDRTQKAHENDSDDRIQPVLAFTVYSIL